MQPRPGSAGALLASRSSVQLVGWFASTTALTDGASPATTIATTDVTAACTNADIGTCATGDFGGTATLAPGAIAGASMTLWTSPPINGTNRTGSEAVDIELAIKAAAVTALPVSAPPGKYTRISSPGASRCAGPASARRSARERLTPPRRLGTPHLVSSPRALPVIREVVTAHPGARVLVVSHKATIRLLLSSLLGFDARGYRDRLDQAPACVNVLDFRDAVRAERDDAAAADRAEVEEIIRSTGFFRAKTKSLLGMANAIVDGHLCRHQLSYFCSLSACRMRR